MVGPALQIWNAKLHKVHGEVLESHLKMSDLSAMQRMVREAREARGWTKTRLAQEASNLAHPDFDIDPNLIWRLEERPLAFVPPAPVFRPIAQALELDLLDLLTAAGYFDVPGERYP